jgi:CubicO group peptidase (beta-lactamase class C family)
LPAAAVAFSTLLCAGAARPADLDSRAIDRLMRRGLRAWHVPGAAVAIVRHGRVVFLRGYGVREYGDSHRVTPDTLFGIASLTKAFTATALAMLVDEGKAKWDDPVRRHVPFFRLADPLADQGVTLRDLLCHRTGLSAHDRLWQHAPWTLEESVRRVAFLKPAHSFRSAYEYNNLMYITAGFAVASASQSTWHDFVQKRIFKPLGMAGARFTKSAVLSTPDHATPHRVDRDGQVQTMPWYDDDRQIRPSGVIKASVRDLASWMRFQLGDGTWEGKRLLSAQALAEMHTPQVVIPLRGRLRALYPETMQMSYGLGWVIHDYRGHLVWSHSGATEGFRAHIMLVPKARLGVVVLMNAETGPGLASIHLAAAHGIVDLLLGLPRKDWNTHFAAIARHVEAEDQAKVTARQAKRHPHTKPSRELEAYAATYEEPAYGRAIVTAKADGLVITWSSARGRLEHFHFDTFDIKGDRLIDGDQVVFHLGLDGNVDSMDFLGVRFRKKDNGQGRP